MFRNTFLADDMCQLKDMNAKNFTTSTISGH